MSVSFNRQCCTSEVEDDSDQTLKCKDEVSNALLHIRICQIIIFIFIFEVEKGINNNNNKSSKYFLTFVDYFNYCELKRFRNFGNLSI